jgi:hypothetical protein
MERTRMDTAAEAPVGTEQDEKALAQDVLRQSQARDQLV